MDSALVALRKIDEALVIEMASVSVASTAVSLKQHIERRNAMQLDESVSWKRSEARLMPAAKEVRFCDGGRPRCEHSS